MLTEREALQWIARHLGAAPETLTPNTRRSDVPGWDSLAVLTLVIGLETDFSIELTDADIEQMRTVGDILDLLAKRGKLSHDHVSA